MPSPGGISPSSILSAPPSPLCVRRTPLFLPGRGGGLLRPGVAVPGPGTVWRAEGGGTAVVGCLPAGSMGSFHLTLVREQTHPPGPRFPRVSAHDVAGVEGGRRGVSGTGGGAESGGGRSFFVFSSAAFSPWQSGQGTRGDLCAGGGDPRAEQRAGALHGLPGRGVSTVHRDTHTRLSWTREPGTGARAGTTRGGARGAWLRSPPSPGFGHSAKPAGALCAPRFP